MRELIDELNDICETEVNMPLSSMTTLRIGGYAKYVVYPNSDIALDGVLRLLKLRNIPFKMIGKGSDLLCSDDDYYGVIIRLDRHFNKAYFTDDMVTVQAGCSTIALAYQAMKNGLSGLEWASGIPGTIGGAIFMNAGAYKSSMADIVEEVFVYRNGKLEWMPVEECDFSYRTSIFQKHSDWIIAGCRMRLKWKIESKEYFHLSHWNFQAVVLSLEIQKERMHGNALTALAIVASRLEMHMSLISIVILL